MKTLFVLLILHNSPDAQSVVHTSEPMTIEHCDNMQRSVWSGQWPTVLAYGETMPVIDAACVPVMPYGDH